MAEPLKRLFTVLEYHSLAETGILREDDRVELIEGEIYRMAPIGSRHAGCVTRLNRILSGLVGKHAVVYIQNPIEFGGSSELQPDLALLRFRADDYSASHPTQNEVLLIIEVADTSLGFDRNVKQPIYARNGVPEFWLVDLTKNTVDIHRQPSPTGYRDIRQLRKDDRISPLALSDIELSVSEILG